MKTLHTAFFSALITAAVLGPRAWNRRDNQSPPDLMIGSKDAIDLTSDGSRRARGFDVWAALSSLGRRGLAELVDRHCEQAAWLAGGLARSGFEVLNDVVLNQVVVAFGSDARTKATIRRLQESGECWCGGTRWHGREAMRISVSSWATSLDDLERTLKAIVAAAAEA